MADKDVSKTEGYSGLAKFISSYSEYSIYRKFGALNAKNILYLQAEIMTLETELEEIAEEDWSSTDAERKQFHQHWQTLSRASQDSGKNLQWEKMLKIRELLEKYSKNAEMPLLETRVPLTSLRYSYPPAVRDFEAGSSRSPWPQDAPRLASTSGPWQLFTKG
jgi:hypothetical protein